MHISVNGQMLRICIAMILRGVPKIMARTKNESSTQLTNMRHSLAHLLASAVTERFPKAKFGIGPAIENGFYYDIRFPSPISDDDLHGLEKRMRELIADDLPFTHTQWTKQKANRFFKNQPLKRELIKELPGKTVGISRVGNFTDLCRGGHVKRTSEIRAFRLTHTAGAYWRGDEKRPQLTRVYGVAFSTEEELERHLAFVEEAKKRDHKILGPKLGLFFFHETAPGMPYWLPKGMIVLNELIRFWREEHEKRGYHEISAPLVNKKELWVTSGHWEHYRDDMFIADMGESDIYGVKAMNCPNAMIVFGSTTRSYKDLPLRLSDTDILHRYERSGTLNGLLRARAFRQDDSHNFIREDQIESEFEAILDIADRFYGIFGLSYRFRLGTRPEKFLGDVKSWNTAEKNLKNILKKRVGEKGYTLAEGDGAFYGPKIDILMEDALGREWQMGTIQLDFQQPRRFDLSYIDEKGRKQTPVVVHRVIYGSLERFIGILIEHFAGALPLWLAPVQARILPVNEHIHEYAEKVLEQCRAAGLRAEIDHASETIGKKIRNGETEKIPVLFIVGQREAEAGTVSVRYHGGKDGGAHTTAEAIARLQNAAHNRRLSIA